MSGKSGRSGRGGSDPDPTVAERAVEAALDELAEHGREGLTMDRVAARAGISKTTMYTRFRTKDELVAAAYRELARPVPPDPGFLEGGFEGLWTTVAAGAADRRYAAVLAELVGASVTDESLREALREVSRQWRSGITALLEAARAQGAVPDDIDVELLTDTIVGLTLHRIIFQQEDIDAAFRRNIDTLVFHSPPRRR